MVANMSRGAGSLTSEALRCDFVRPGGNPCRAFRVKGRPFCFRHDPIEKEKRAARELAASLPATPDVEVPTTRPRVRDLLQRTLRGVLLGEVDPRRGKVVQDLCRQLLPLLPPEEEPEPEEARLTDEEMLVRMETEVSRCRARIAAK